MEEGAVQSDVVPHYVHEPIRGDIERWKHGAFQPSQSQPRRFPYRAFPRLLGGSAAPSRLKCAKFPGGQRRIAQLPAEIPAPVAAELAREISGSTTGNRDSNRPALARFVNRWFQERTTMKPHAFADECEPFFANRIEAAKRLEDYRGQNPLVLGSPRGRVLMAQVIAESLGGDLDVVRLHERGAPNEEEFAIGSVSKNSSRRWRIPARRRPSTPWASSSRTSPR
jgi:hypothetical protein